MVDHETVVRTKFRALSPVMDERLTRLWAGAKAGALGDGGIAIVERATGLSRTTIRAGRDELHVGVSTDDVVAVRRPGGGRPRLEAGARAVALVRTPVRAGRDELHVGVSTDDVVAVRRPGGGRPRLEEATPAIVEALERLVDPGARGGPGYAPPW